MNKNKFQLIVFTWLFFITALYFFGFSGAGDRSVSIGWNASILDRDTNLVVIYGSGDSVKMIINRSTGNIYFGSSTVNTTKSIYAGDYQGMTAMSRLNSLVVGADISPSTTFYVSGTSQMTGYLTGDSIYARTIKTPTLSGTATTGTSAVYSNINGTDSVKAGYFKGTQYLFRTKTNPTLDKNEMVMYCRDSLIVLKYKTPAGVDCYYYANLAAGLNITELTYSAGEP